MGQEDFLKWLNNASKKEIELREKAISFEGKYFADLTLKKFEKEFLQVLNEETGALTCFELPELDISLKDWKFNIIKELGNPAKCKENARIIEIDEHSADDDSSLLHEMIHAYEYLLGEKFEGYKQYLAIILFQKLLPRIPDLLDLITLDIRSAVMEHTVLFMLKSLDLDLTLHKPLGSIYFYGKEEICRNSSNQSQK